MPRIKRFLKFSIWIPFTSFNVQVRHFVRNFTGYQQRYAVNMDIRWCIQFRVNSLRLSDAYIRQYSIPILLQIMVCRLFGDKPLSEPMLPYCQLGRKEHISVKFIQNSIYQENALENNCRPFCLGPNLLIIGLFIGPNHASHVFWNRRVIFPSLRFCTIGRSLNSGQSIE